MNPWPSARTAAGVTVSLAGRRALVTGAATGIGRATALRLAQAGALVWMKQMHGRGQADAKAKIPPDLIRTERPPLVMAA